MLRYPTNSGESLKPALVQYGKLTVEQACAMA